MKNKNTVADENKIPPLPAGVNIVDKNPTMELNSRCDKKWVVLMQALKALPSTRAMEIDVAGCSNSRINTIRVSMRKAAKFIGVNPDLVTFSVDRGLNKLNAWIR